MQPNHDTALRHAQDVATDTTKTPSHRNLARAYLSLLERMHRAAERGEALIEKVETMLNERAPLETISEGELDALARQMGGAP